MKVKLFRGNASEVEQQLNDWLATTPLHLVKLLQSESLGGVTVTVFYEEAV